MFRTDFDLERMAFELYRLMDSRIHRQYSWLFLDHIVSQNSDGLFLDFHLFLVLQFETAKKLMRLVKTLANYYYFALRGRLKNKHM